MNNPNFDFLKSKFNVSQETFLILRRLSSKRELAAGEKIVKQGGKSKKIYLHQSVLWEHFHQY